ncbi:predicted transcriptional regulator [Saccharomonospora viridis DSM 43017]|uniref:Predicted transcriptional regulator n=2 Tax=Saccharomonospora viridis TaxID=1852 RepID=C7MTB8_SACVD|nr:predicted transcriptional regulator [Saccharomonospora viridis DSM 43017]
MRRNLFAWFSLPGLATGVSRTRFPTTRSGGFPMGENDVGRRIREVRAWRGLSLRATAELTGITHGYLAQLERGEKPVKNRQLLEALARTLRVSPR